MDLQKMNDTVKEETDSLIPQGLLREEKSAWLMSYNAIRLADLSRGNPYGAEVVAMQATAGAILAAHCDPISSMPVSADNKVITVVCSNPRSDTEEFLKERDMVFPLWDFSVTSISAPNGVHEKIVFKR